MALYKEAPSANGVVIGQNLDVIQTIAQIVDSFLPSSMFYLIRTPPT